MTEIEQYEFDRQGYLVIEGMLTPREVTVLSAAVVDELEEHADKTGAGVTGRLAGLRGVLGHIRWMRQSQLVNCCVGSEPLPALHPGVAEGRCRRRLWRVW